MRCRHQNCVPHRSKQLQQQAGTTPFEELGVFAAEMNVSNQLMLKLSASKRSEET
jgi:hypothetical protein